MVFKGIYWMFGCYFDRLSFAEKLKNIHPALINMGIACEVCSATLPKKNNNSFGNNPVQKK